MSFIQENVRLRELAIIASTNKPFFDDFLGFLASQGYSSLYNYVQELDAVRAREVLYRYFTAHMSPVHLYDGVASPYAAAKAKWLFVGWIFRDAPEQRLKPMIASAAGATPIQRQVSLLEVVRQHVREVFPEEDSWTWLPIREVFIDRLEGSRRAKKGTLFENVVRRALQDLIDHHKLSLTVANVQVSLDGETYDVVIKGSRSTMLIPVKTRETMGGGHAHIFTRDIHKSISAATENGYVCVPVIIAESWTGDLAGLNCAAYVYIPMNPNQVEAIIPVLRSALENKIAHFAGL